MDVLDADKLLTWRKKITLRGTHSLIGGDCSAVSACRNPCPK
jgi:hypothetical protein